MSGTQPIGVTASDNVSVADGAIMIDGARGCAARDSASRRPATGTPRSLEPAATELQSKVQDAAGNVGMSAPVDVTVNSSDITQPSVTITCSTGCVRRRPRRADANHSNLYGQCRRRTRENVRRRLGHLRAEGSLPASPCRGPPPAAARPTFRCRRSTLLAKIAAVASVSVFPR